MPSFSVNDLVGCRFKVHGRNKEEGFDCYGLAIEVMKRNGINLPDVFYSDLMNREKTYEELMKKIKIEKLNRPVKCCIVMINVKGNPCHVGVYLDEGMMIHSTENHGVIIEPIRRYENRIVGYYKVNN